MAKKQTIEKLLNRIKELEKAEESLAVITRYNKERVKELNCLYSISRIVESGGQDVHGIMQKIVDTIPSSWQYPEITCVKITLSEREYKTANFKKTKWKQDAPITINGEKDGVLEVFYLEKTQTLDEGPFFKEERSLINAVVERIGRIIERIQREIDLQEKSRHLEEVNIALKVMLNQKNEDKIELGENILSNVKELVHPYIENLKNGNISKKQETLIEIIESNLTNIISPFIGKLSSKYYGLTPMEITVASLVKDGKINKNIAVLLNLSTNTILTHRHHIRAKLGLKNKKINLRSHLLSLQ
jgi:DNA-binding CsgD family transcriptional regulator